MLPARRPYPDELICSAVLRCCRQFNVPIKRLGRVALGRPSWRPSFLGATCLPELGELFRISPEDVLWLHTPFPYATAMMGHEFSARALKNAFGEHLQARGLGAVTQNASSGLPFRRFCIKCADEDLERHRESYWHRSHNLPAVWVCSRHKCYLHDSRIPVSSSGPVDASLPHECRGGPIGRGDPTETLLSVAATSTAWLLRERIAGTPLMPADYRSMAIGNGWLSPHRPVSAAAVESTLAALLPTALLKEIDPRGKRPEQSWLALMLRPATDVPFVPSKHAVIRSLLARGRPPDCPRLDHVSSGPGGSEPDRVDAFYARAARTQLRAALRQGQILTTEQFLRSAGCLGAYRHRKDQLPKLRAVVREFRSSAATVKRLRPEKTLFRKSHAPMQDSVAAQVPGTLPRTT